MGERAKPKLEGEEDLHLELTPWEFVVTYLTGKERRFMRSLMKKGDYVQAMTDGGFRCSLPEVLGRPTIRAAIRRNAWLCADPIVSAKILMPLVLQKQTEIAMREGKNQLSATKEITAMSGLQPANKKAVLLADMTQELSRGQGEEERPWVDKRLPWRKVAGQPGLLPHIAVDRTEEEIREAIKVVLEPEDGQ